MEKIELKQLVAKVPESERTAIKIFAAGQRKTISEIVRAGIRAQMEAGKVFETAAEGK